MYVHIMCMPTIIIIIHNINFILYTAIKAWWDLWPFCLLYQQLMVNTHENFIGWLLWSIIMQLCCWSLQGFTVCWDTFLLRLNLTDMSSNIPSHSSLRDVVSLGSVSFSETSEVMSPLLSAWDKSSLLMGAASICMHFSAGEGSPRVNENHRQSTGQKTIARLLTISFLHNVVILYL